MRISAKGLINHAANELEAHGPNNEGIDYAAAYAFSLREMSNNMHDMADRYLAGDVTGVDEFIKLYCLGKD